jgi:hypothetical protein
MTTLRRIRQGEGMTLECGCGCHLEGKDEQSLSIKLLLHLEAAHPEIEEPTIELAEEMVSSIIKVNDESLLWGRCCARTLRAGSALQGDERLFLEPLEHRSVRKWQPSG